MPISHKAAVQGLRDVWLQFGQAMFSVAGLMLIFALGAFAFKTWVLVSWPRANGTVIDSIMTMKKAADGTAECAAVESVQYFADGQSFIVKDGGRKLARDCAGVERTLAALRGQPRTIAYNKSLPDATYTNPAFNAEFYRDGLLLARIAILAGILGLAAIQRHRRLKCRR